jgi:hypothetical protein
VLMHDGSLKPANHIRAGDMVQTGVGTSSPVRCVVYFPMLHGVTHLVDVNGLLLTPYHPLRLSNALPWVFPADIAPTKLVPCVEVVNFVLEHGHSMFVDGIECVTLGHGFSSSPVTNHPFFATSAVVEHLQSYPGWHGGEVVMSPYAVATRDPATGLINGWSDSGDSDSLAGAALTPACTVPQEGSAHLVCCV